ncbi:MAG: hypothetical protein KIG83_03425 [Treponema sp.]|nr:hypothetical protein [Treponema sp.]
MVRLIWFCKNSTGANISKAWASEGSHSLEMTMDVMDKNSTKSGIRFYDGTNEFIQWYLTFQSILKDLMM